MPQLSSQQSPNKDLKEKSVNSTNWSADQENKTVDGKSDS